MCKGAFIFIKYYFNLFVVLLKKNRKTDNKQLFLLFLNRKTFVCKM